MRRLTLFLVTSVAVALSATAVTPVPEPEIRKDNQKERGFVFDLTVRRSYEKTMQDGKWIEVRDNHFVEITLDITETGKLAHVEFINVFAIDPKTDRLLFSVESQFTRTPTGDDKASSHVISRMICVSPQMLDHCYIGVGTGPTSGHPSYRIKLSTYLTEDSRLPTSASTVPASRVTPAAVAPGAPREPVR